MREREWVGEVGGVGGEGVERGEEGGELPMYILPQTLRMWRRFGDACGASRALKLSVEDGRDSGQSGERRCNLLQVVPTAVN